MHSCHDVRPKCGTHRQTIRFDEGMRHARDSPGSLALPIASLSSDEVAQALSRLGFVATRVRGDEGAAGHLLERRLRRVSFPHATSLSPDALLAIVREAGVTYSELVEALEVETVREASDRFPRRDSQVRRRS